MPDVRLDRGLTDEERAGDLGVAQPASHEAEHVDLALGEPLQDGGRRGVGRRQSRGEPVEQSPGDARGDHGVTAGHYSDGRHQVVRRHVLEEESARTGTQRLDDVFVEVERGEDQHPGVPRRVAVDDAPRRLDAVHARHSHVHEHHVRLQRAHGVEGLQAVRGLADHGDVRLGLQDHAEAGPQ